MLAKGGVADAKGLVGRVVGVVLRAIFSFGGIFDQVVKRGFGDVGRRFRG